MALFRFSLGFTLASVLGDVLAQLFLEFGSIHDFVTWILSLFDILDILRDSAVTAASFLGECCRILDRPCSG